MNRTEFYDNIRQSMEQERYSLGLTQSEMAKKLDISLASYKRIITGETDKIDLYLAHKLFQLSGKSLGVLAKDDTNAVLTAQKLHTLSDSQLAYVNAIIDFESRFRANTRSDEYISVLVPTGNMSDGMIYDTSSFIKVDAGDYIKRFGDRLHFGIQITSNHLHPVYNAGDILLLCAEPPRDGDTGVFLNSETNRAYIRKFRQGDMCRLEPIGNNGRVITVNASDPDDMRKWIKLGYVLTKMRV